MQGTTSKKKYIAPIEILNCYDSGLPDLHQSAGLTFNWYSWVLCDVALYDTNVVHRAIFTDFRCDNFRSPGKAKAMRVTFWNPSYDNPHEEDKLLSEFWYWKPINVVLLRS